MIATTKLVALTPYHLSLPARTRKLEPIPVTEQPTAPTPVIRGSTSYNLVVMKQCGNCKHLEQFSSQYCGGCGLILTDEEQTATI